MAAAVVEVEVAAEAVAAEVAAAAEVARLITDAEAQPNLPPPRRGKDYYTARTAPSLVFWGLTARRSASYTLI